MASYGMCNGISQSVRDAVNQINKVGVANLKRYCEQFHPKCKFDESMRIIRSVAMHGYSEAGRIHDVTHQYAHQTLMSYYKIAKEAEVWQEKS